MPNKINAGEVLGKIFDRFRRQANWKLLPELTVEEKNDRKQFIAASLEVLGAARIPPEFYDRLYRRAMVSRARRRAAGEFVNSQLSAEDLVVEWFVLKKEEANISPDEKDLEAEKCPERNKHIGDEQIVEYCFSGQVDVKLPCQRCRPKAYEQRKKEFTEKHNASFANRRLTTADESEIKKQEIVNKQTEIRLSDEEAEILQDEHNHLVRELSEPSDWAELELIFDKNTNVFKLPHRTALAVPPEVMKVKIQSYRNILAKRTPLIAVEQNASAGADR